MRFARLPAWPSVASVPDAIFAEPRLAAVYDLFDGERDDLDAYLAIAAERGARHVLDVGCGTGSLAVLLAERGHLVTAVDPAQASLAVARSKDPDARVTWRHGEAASLPAVGADLAVMTGNVAQLFLSDAEWTAALRGVGRALRPGGSFVFETRRPERKGWEEWSTAPVTKAGVQQQLELTRVAMPYLSFRHTYRFLADGTVLTSASTLRFRDPDELTRGLLAEGFEVVDVRDAPDRPGLEFVFVTIWTGAITRP